MHPRLKMRRGRFGAGGFKAPLVRITSPVNGAVVLATGSPALGYSVTLTGTSADDVGGDLSSAIVWTSSVGSPIPTDTGASVALLLQGFGSPDLRAGSPVTDSGSPLSGGVSHTITATSTDAGGLVGTAQITITVIGN